MIRRFQLRKLSGELITVDVTVDLFRVGKALAGKAIANGRDKASALGGAVKMQIVENKE